MHRYIHQIEQFSQALFVGFFGPIGVGAIFYLSVCRQFLLEEMIVDGEVRADAARTAEVTYIVVWFLVICSIVSICPYNWWQQANLNSSFTASASPLAKQVIISHAQSQQRLALHLENKKRFGFPAVQTLTARQHHNRTAVYASIESEAKRRVHVSHPGLCSRLLALNSKVRDIREINRRNNDAKVPKSRLLLMRVRRRRCHRNQRSRLYLRR